MGIKIFSHNVNGIRDYVKRRKVFNYFKNKQADIVCLQETYSEVNNEKFWKSEWGGHIIFSHGTHHSCGVTILFRKDLNFEILNTLSDANGRYLICHLKINNREVIISNLYGPNYDSPGFYARIFSLLEQSNHPEWITTGDFNIILDSILDSKSCRPHANRRAADMVRDCMEQYGLIDVWRQLHNDVKRYTFRRGGSIASRLDFFLISESFSSLVKKSEILPSILSDHSVVLLDIALDADKRGPGFWKMNTKWINHPEFKQIMNEAIDSVLIKNQQEKLDPLLNWEMIKNEIVGVSIGFSVHKAKEQNKIFEEMEAKILQIENNIDLMDSNDPTLPDIIREYIFLKNEYDQKFTDKINKIITYTKAKWFNEGQNCTKYFLNMQKTRTYNQCMNKIHLDDGTVVTERKKILLEQKKFYEQLYAPDFDVKCTAKPYPNTIRLSDIESDQTNEPITVEQLYSALISLSNGKTPGTDGIPPEFYKEFWDKINSSLLKAYQFALESGSLHSSARRGILNLIPKKNRDPLYITNWRPITLLNTDYKILSKCLANRIQKHVNNIISQEQTGFIKGRNISSNIRKIIDLQDYCSDQQIDSCLLVLDFYKCFDTISTRNLKTVFRYFNFGSQFADWVSVLLSDIQLCTLNFGYISEHFGVGRGVLQGNPIASLIYLLYGQILLERILNNTAIEGIPIGDYQLKAIQFADDLNIPIIFSQASIDAVLAELKNCKAQLGLQCNLEKSCIYRMGPIANSTCILNSQGIPWTNNDVTILGVTITKSDKIEEKNLDPVVGKMQNLCDVWNQRDLSLVGKATVINVLLMSLLVYKLTVLPILSKSYVSKINGIWSRFLWNERKPKINWNIITAPKKNGGLGLSDLNKRDISLKTQWVQRVFKDSCVKNFAMYFLNTPVMNTIWQCALSVKDVKYVTQCKNFWYDVLCAWCQFNFKSPTGRNEIMEQIIWFNSHIRIENKPFCKTNMFKAGIVKITHLLDETFKFYSVDTFRAKFPNINYIDYIATIRAIPMQWKQVLVDNLYANHDPEFPGIAVLEQNTSIVSIVYTALHKNVYLLAMKVDKWEQLFGYPIWPTDFNRIVNRTWNLTVNAKLRSFQYRLLLHAIPTNEKLKKWKILQSDLCTFCNRHVETVSPLFFNCTIVKPIWCRVFEWLKNLDPELEMVEDKIMFNNLHANPKSVINTITLITKFYLYKTRCAHCEPNIFALIEEILACHKMEQLGAITRQRKLQINDKWDFILNTIRYQNV